MKILIVVNNYLQKDVVSSKRWRCLSKEFARMNHEVTVLCGEDPAYNGTMLTNEDFNNDNLKIFKVDTTPTFEFVKKFKRNSSKYTNENSQAAFKRVTSNNNKTINEKSVNNERKIQILKLLKEILKDRIMESESRKVLTSSDIYDEIKKNHYEVIIASVYYENAYYAASFIHRFHKNAILVCDIRDRLFNSPIRTPEFDATHRCLGRRIFKECDIVTTVNNNIRNDLCQNVKNSENAYKKCKVFPHAFDEEEDAYNLNDDRLIVSRPKDALQITFTGLCQHVIDNMEHLFAVVKRLIETSEIKKGEIIINYAGKDSKLVESLAEKYNLTEVVRDYGFVPKQNCLAIQQESDVLLNLSNEITGKIPEYLLRKKYLLIIHEKEMTDELDGISKLVKEANLGSSISIHDKDCEERIQSVLVRLHDEKMKNGEIRYEGIDSEIQKYSIHHIAKQMLECFEECMR